MLRLVHLQEKGFILICKNYGGALYIGKLKQENYLWFNTLEKSYKIQHFQNVCQILMFQKDKGIR